MRNLALRDAVSPEIESVAGCFPDAHTLDEWLRAAWQIVPDPPDSEFVMSPALMVRCQWYAGDCDDAATFAACLLKAMHITSQLVAIRTSTDIDFSHVFCRIPAMRLDIDPIVPQSALPIRYVEAMVLNV